jgi:2-polyprenyl-3-methyl-5-hydroxy-6-metoxy-1,4-benzoquinol methylase
MQTLSHIRCPTKLRYLYRDFKNKKFNILDIGCGNNSPTLFKKWFPKANYFGIDKSIYNNTKKDLEIMQEFYQLDLTKLSFDSIEDNYFDVIFMSHVIEHLPNGLDVLKKLIKKLKKNGTIYIEFPSTNSLSFPSARGTLHFCDDETHIKLYDLKEISNLLLSNNFKIIKAGKARDLIRILLFFISIPYQIYSLLKHKKLTVKYGLWDLVGFSHFIYARLK